MRVIELSAIARAPAAHEPYVHFIGSGVLKPEAVAPLLADFPAMDLPGYFPKDDVPAAGSFADLLADLDDPAFSLAVGEKLGMALADKPKLITIRRWSAAADGRIHTDSAGKIATVLVYLNAQWADAGEGRLRVLRSAKTFDDYTAEISPTMGTVFGFKRADNSWHGHLPFVGERRVVQITWLTDEAKLARKKRTSKFTSWLKRLNPFT